MNRLQERRMALGLTQPQVSARLKETEPRADVGMVSRYEKGVCLPTADQLKALEDVLGASRTELYDAEDLDLLGALPTAESRSEASETETAPPTAPTGRFRKSIDLQKALASDEAAIGTDGSKNYLDAPENAPEALPEANPETGEVIEPSSNTAPELPDGIFEDATGQQALA